MKTASSVFNIISIILYVIVGLVVGRQRGYEFIWAFLGPAIAVCLIHKIVTHSSTRKGGGYIFQGILDIFFGSVLAGILMLCVREEDM